MNSGIIENRGEINRLRENYFRNLVLARAIGGASEAKLE